MEIERAYQLGYRHFLCGMAMGTDLMAGEAVAAAKALYPDILLEAAVPCENQTRRWPREAAERYRALLAQCDVVPEQFLPYTEDSMMRRNRYMVEASSRIIGVYDGHSGGGTRNTLILALRAGLDVVLIDPEHPEEAPQP